MIHIEYKKLNKVINRKYECKRAILKHIKPTFYVKPHSFSINAPVFYVEDGVETDSHLDLIGPLNCTLSMGTTIEALAHLLKEDPRDDFNLEQLVNLPCRVVVDPAKSISMYRNCRPSYEGLLPGHECSRRHSNRSHCPGICLVIGLNETRLNLT